MGFFELILAIAIGIPLGFYILAGGLEAVLWIVGLIVVGALIFNAFPLIIALIVINWTNITTFVGLGVLIYIIIKLIPEIKEKVKGKTIKEIAETFFAGIAIRLAQTSIFNPKNFIEYCFSGIIWLCMISVVVVFLFVFISFLVR